MRPQCFFLILILHFIIPFLLSGGASSAGRVSALPIGWKAIENVREAHVLEIGNFAVTEHNKEAKGHLKLDMVVEGQTQIVNGTNYWLVVAAKDYVGTNIYTACVLEKAWLENNPFNLTLWKKFDDTDTPQRNSC
ncbi:cysteine proteinase inhibitor 1-like [Malania oleifera]|uniref:cysteine proteinase inhibitor 1-like n=1 Tax=Malania oleifera TaxID=397392 RepID=UPI0025ADB8F7|nr:cysteine proteinase inhibitor 1-like [Malania oleifera]